MRVAFATCSLFPDGWDDDQSAASLLSAEFRSWDDPAVDWERFDRVVLRSVFDYHHRPDEFLAWCRAVGAERLRNSPELVAFNADKRYLSELSAPTVPTTYVHAGEPLPDQPGEFVVKPSVSAGARDTGRFSHVSRADEVAPAAPDGVGRELEVAHAMFDDDLVVPGDAAPDDLRFAERLLAEVSERFGAPLYLRVDLVRNAEESPVLLELEAIDPVLYLELTPGADRTFAAAVLAS